MVQTHFADFCNILIDLPGHGKSTGLEKVAFEEILATLLTQLEGDGIEKFTPIGYSMGGRLAFHLHQLNPERIKALIFLSSAPGLKTPSEQKQRRLDDIELLDKLESSGYADFLEKWYAAELFGDIRKNTTLMQKVFPARSKNDIGQLRQSLDLMGNGALPSLWNELKDIGVPTLLMSGTQDSKYTQLNQEIQQNISGSIHHELAETGHAFHLEKPLETAQIIRHFLRKLFEGE